MRIPYLISPAASTQRFLPEYAAKSPAQAALALEEFLSEGRATIVLSGAGISVDSRIPDYRGMNCPSSVAVLTVQGPAGTYTLNNSYRPIFFHEFVTRDKARRRYW
jgi:hypothetical protein